MADTRLAADTLIAEGWAVLPVPHGRKQAAVSWLDKTFSRDDFGPDDNIAGKCGEPSGWKIDIDLDHALAVKIAPSFLPPTKLIHGRPGKLTSHYWYHCVGAKTRKFQDVAGGVEPESSDVLGGEEVALVSGELLVVEAALVSGDGAGAELALVVALAAAGVAGAAVEALGVMLGVLVAGVAAVRLASLRSSAALSVGKSFSSKPFDRSELALRTK